MSLERRATGAAFAAAALVGLLGGAALVMRPLLAVLLALAVTGVIALALLGERAFAWALTLVAVIPWYPFVSDVAGPPRVPQKALCAAIAAAPLVPWLWTIATRRRGGRPRSRWMLLVVVLYGGYTLLIYGTLGGLTPMISSSVVGFLFGGVTFLCARAVGDARGWPAAGFAGFAALVLMGLDAYAAAPDNRIGYFTGYPITYGALVVGLLPVALVLALRRSRLLALATAVAAVVVLIMSESRSAWVAAAVMLIVLVALLARTRQRRALMAVAAVTVTAVGLIFATGSLHRVVERQLSAQAARSSSVTHRTWSYAFAGNLIREQPLFGFGAPGFSALRAANETDIGAIDNGYLSITVDMGLVGLLGAVLPIGVALAVLGRCLRRRRAPALDVALALGVLGMAVVTIFYDSFYWASIVLLMAGMGGTLSVRWASIGARPPAAGVRPAGVRPGP